MHFSTKQKQTHRQSRPVAAKGRRGWGEERVSRHKLVHTASKDMPAAQHRELSSVSCDKSQRKRMWKKCETHTDVKWKSLSRVRLFAIPWTVQPMEFSRLPEWLLEWGAFPFSRGSSQPRERTQVSRIAERFFTSWTTREATREDTHTHIHKKLNHFAVQQKLTSHCKSTILKFF